MAAGIQIGQLLIEQGVHIGEFHYLEDLARDKVYEFAFMMQPLKIQGGTDLKVSIVDGKLHTMSGTIDASSIDLADRPINSSARLSSTSLATTA